MIVVAIIGILAGLAVPKFNLFQAKARQAEVKSNLSSIYTLQQSYFGDNDAYFAFANLTRANCAAGQGLGFTPAPCGQLRYTYGSVVTANPPTFVATGTAAVATIYPGCAAPNGTADTWSIDQNKTLVAGTGLAACGGG